MINSMNFTSLLLELHFYPKFTLMEVIKLHAFKQSINQNMVWDTAGQQKYKSIAPIYYRESQVALCVYDITSKNSFQVMKNWVQQLKAKGPAEILLAVVGNKIDKTDDEEVPFNEAKQYAQSINALFKLTSAKQGKGINQLFTTIGEKIEENKARKQLGNRQTIQIKKSKGNQKKKGGCCGGKDK